MDRLIIDYLPPVLREVPEFQALMAAEQPELAALWTEQARALDNQFLGSAAELGVRRWERMLKINPQATASLAERKFAVSVRLAEQLPYTLRTLERMLTELCGEGGFGLFLAPGAYRLSVEADIEARSSRNEIARMLRRVVPANMVTALEYAVRPDGACTSYAAAGAGGMEITILAEVKVYGME